MNVLFELIKPFLGELIILLTILGGLFGLKRKWVKEERERESATRAKASAEAERQRREIKDDVAKEPDLVARAKRAGVVRGSGSK